MAATNPPKNSLKVVNQAYSTLKARGRPLASGRHSRHSRVGRWRNSPTSAVA